jgi:hypothetical protein
MKISASDIQLTERYLLGRLPPASRLLFEARLILQPKLQENLQLQQQVHQLVKQRGRQQLKAQINAVQKQLFTEPAYKGFSQKVAALFGL